MQQLASRECEFEAVLARRPDSRDFSLLKIGNEELLYLHAVSGIGFH